jgi:hypothetical protein
MKTNDFPANIRVASPCIARWGHMVGNDRVRFCLQCQKHVYNFSAMSAQEIAATVREKDGKLCARFYQRADGTMLTADCPLGVGRFWRQVKARMFASAALLAVAAGATMAVTSGKAETGYKPPGKFTLLWQNACLKVETWLGLAPQRRAVMGKMVMGDICVTPPPAPKTPSTAQP